MDNVTYLPTTTGRVEPSTFDRVCQGVALVVLAVAGTVAAGVAFGGFCLEGSPICEARTVQLSDFGPMFNPEATLDAGQVIDKR